jgi:hypothetical protein
MKNNNSFYRLFNIKRYSLNDNSCSQQEHSMMNIKNFYRAYFYECQFTKSSFIMKQKNEYRLHKK